MTAPIFVMQPQNMVAKGKNVWYNGFIVEYNLIDKSKDVRRNLLWNIE